MIVSGSMKVLWGEKKGGGEKRFEVLKLLAIVVLQHGIQLMEKM